MATITEKARSYFPLQSVDDVVSLFRSELQESEDAASNTEEPNLTLLSVVVCYFAIVTDELWNSCHGHVHYSNCYPA